MKIEELVSLLKLLHFEQVSGTDQIRRYQKYSANWRYEIVFNTFYPESSIKFRIDKMETTHLYLLYDIDKGYPTVWERISQVFQSELRDIYLDRLLDGR